MSSKTRKGENMHRYKPWLRFVTDDDGEGGGGQPDEEDPKEESDEGADDDNPDGADQLGDPGKRALDEMKAKWKAERKARQDLQAKLDQAGQQKDDPGAKAAQEVVAKANARIVRSEVRAAAAGKLADPKDALKFLDLDQFEVGEDGDIDEDEIADAIDDLISKKPYLAAQSRKKGSMDGGVRNESRPRQLTRADLGRMSPEEIEKARKQGRLKTLMGG